jgi:hypothetical protein
MQVSRNLLGLPMNYNAFLEKTESMISGAYYEPEITEEPLDAEEQATYDSYVALVDKYTDLLNAYTEKDAYISDTVSAEAAYFFESTKTAAEVADTLQNKISLYLNE